MNYYGAHGGLQYDLDAVADVLLRRNLQCRFFRKFDEGAEVGGQFVEDSQARGGIECIAAAEGFEGDLDQLRFGAMAEARRKVGIREQRIVALAEDNAGIGDGQRLPPHYYRVCSDVSEAL